MPKSRCNNIVMTNIQMDCRNFFDVGTSDKYLLRDFTFKNINVKDEKKAFDKTMIENTIVENVTIMQLQKTRITQDKTQVIRVSKIIFAN